jgi:hypothetical protein
MIKLIKNVVQLVLALWTFRLLNFASQAPRLPAPTPLGFWEEVKIKGTEVYKI